MATTSIKRPKEEDSLDGPGREAKKLKSRFQDDSNGDGKSDQDTTEQLSSSQIREMMMNAQKMIEERKRSLNQPPALLKTTPVLSSLPTPVAPKAVPPSSMDERARKIAELQAQIQSKLATSTLATLNLSLPKTASVPASTGEGSNNEPKPGPLILNADGRTVDATGKEIALAQYTPTLKANIRAKKREVLKTHMGKGSQQQSEEAGNLTESRFFDPRVAAKSSVRTRRTFHFHEQGKFQQVASRMRMKAQLDKLQSEISQIARKTGINSVTALALVAPRVGDRQEEEDIDLEWWDSVILQTRSYEGEDGQPNLRQETITNLIEHPIQMRAPTDPLALPYLPVFLTEKERKKLRRTTRRENWKEKQENIRLGLEPPPQAKVRISNLMRVLGNEAIQDPTKIEAHVREQMAKRLQNHQEANASRKLTADQRREKKEKKLQEDTTTSGVHVAIYRIKDLSNLSKKFKIETNAKQLYMTGCAVIFKDVNVVIVEGGPKQQKKYKRLMLNRIRWEEDAVKVSKHDTGSSSQPETRNSCQLVWEGTTKQRNFGDLIFKLCPSEVVAREHFRKHGVEHYWDLSYSTAVLEETEEK
ncbi:U4/U6 small nuclear ribonucleoprotein Prp3-like [Daphnia pulex]|jgi:U4/U6 small nuclear ribonucleoprotein PRP3|uniref:U4/U6 small nuclear ribonucleoprotein Prp3-like n=1 Tax=Daphnia pulex TaxID=6669 RepID=UPI001EDC93F0|nr:U4/U6 small nuclear ribonucleoprotein Prp3-like [Daphnia pulex]XP_046452337.1 U4/U6 small nuclear ribonucleoprotein Prp3-like [Daphnia pulex]XP_046649812.1 U4/U6 small nuclear ribonucleoprotein Prp3-like [Daphnia pulicaria]XP_046649813.1 U4/U6 small nuclear ribonucleoprotein Prp3-like [Daphnia pulicaria]